MSEETYREEVKRVIEGARMSTPKFIRDPIHDLIRIDDSFVLDIVDSIPMQRLKRIRQLGLSYYVYPGAEHTRFSHSLGAYHLAGKFLKQVNETDQYRSFLVRIAALVHDVGHGPFSHLFEKALKNAGYRYAVDHESWSKRIIGDNDGLGAVLGRVDPAFAADVADLLSHRYKPEYLSCVISSQFDVDRFDYMLRDCHMTGVHYGEFDLNWMLRNLSLEDVQVRDEDGHATLMKKVVVDLRRGLSSLEEYLLGNYYLYVHVYYHKTVQAAEGMLVAALSRAFALARDSSNQQVHGVAHPVLSKIATDVELTVADYLSLDDNVLLSWIERWAADECTDECLRDLCSGLRNRELFKVFKVPSGGKKYADIRDAIRDILNAHGSPPENYLIESEPTRTAYKNFFFLLKRKELDQEIYYKDHRGDILPYTGISDEHVISRAILDLKFESSFIIVPPMYYDEITEAIKELIK